MGEDYVAGLPDTSGTFTGYYDPAVIAELYKDLPELIPVEIDTYGKPNPLATCPKGAVLTVTMGDRQFTFPVDHVENVHFNRWRAWCVRDGIREVPVSPA